LRVDGGRFRPFAAGTLVYALKARRPRRATVRRQLPHLRHPAVGQRGPRDPVEHRAPRGRPWCRALQHHGLAPQAALEPERRAVANPALRPDAARGVVRVHTDTRATASAAPVFEEPASAGDARDVVVPDDVPLLVTYDPRTDPEIECPVHRVGAALRNVLV